MSPTKFMNQVRNKKFAKQIDWISDELFPEKFREKEPDPWAEIKKLQAENEKLSARLEDLEAFVKKLSVRVEKCETTEKCETPEKVFSLPQEVFQPPSLDLYSLSFKTLVNFILEGFVSGIKPDGPKTHKMVLVNNSKEYLPDLVKQILTDHVLSVLEKETEEERKKRHEFFVSISHGKINDMTLSELAMFSLHLRQLKPELIANLSKAIMKMI